MNTTNLDNVPIKRQINQPKMTNKNIGHFDDQILPDLRLLGGSSQLPTVNQSFGNPKDKYLFSSWDKKIWEEKNLCNTRLVQVSLYAKWAPYQL